MGNGLDDMDAVSDEKVENASSLVHITKKKTSVAAYSRKRLIDAPIQSCVIQRRTSTWKLRSTVKLEVYKLQNHLFPEIDDDTKRSTRVRKSLGTPVWHQMKSPGYSASIAVNVSSEDNGSELGASNSDQVNLNGGEMLESSCKHDPLALFRLLHMGSNNFLYFSVHTFPHNLVTPDLLKTPHWWNTCGLALLLIVVLRLCHCFKYHFIILNDGIGLWFTAHVTVKEYKCGVKKFFGLECKVAHLH